jgi:uncharacterized protein YkwD
MHKRKILFTLSLMVVLFVLSACQLQQTFQAWIATSTPTATMTLTPTATATATLTPTATSTLTPTATFTATFTATATKKPYPTSTKAPVPGENGGCGGSNSAFAQQVVSLINQERANAGLSSLSVSGSLSSAAMGHSQDMAENNFFSHTGSNGSDLAGRLAAAGYSFSTAGENIYAGGGSNDSPYSAVSSWMGSEGHRANILSSAFTEIGVGYWCNTNSEYEGYFTADFGRR